MGCVEGRLLGPGRGDRARTCHGLPRRDGMTAHAVEHRSRDAAAAKALRLLSPERQQVLLECHYRRSLVARGPLASRHTVTSGNFSCQPARVSTARPQCPPAPVARGAATSSQAGRVASTGPRAPARDAGCRARIRTRGPSRTLRCCPRRSPPQRHLPVARRIPARYAQGSRCRRGVAGSAPADCGEEDGAMVTVCVRSRSPG